MAFQVCVPRNFNELDGAIYAAFGETEDHMQLLVEKYGEGRDFTRIPDSELHAAIRAPLLQYANLLTTNGRYQLRICLQYLLNHDELIPYAEPNQLNPEWREKTGALSQKVRNSAQDAFTPYDGYTMCQWMWEIIFVGENWHADISNWVVS